MLLTASRRTLATLGVLLWSVMMASPAQAGDASAIAYLMTASDLSADYGAVRSSDSTDLGRVLPSSCNPPVSGTSTAGRETISAPYTELDFSGGLSIQNTVYRYRSPSAARASFDQLRSRTLATCRGEVFTPYGDDQAIVPQVVAAGARVLPPVHGSPRFSVGQSVILLEPASAPPGYADLFTYGVFTLIDNAIVQVQAYAQAPIAPATRADLQRVNEIVVGRYSAAVR